VVPLSLELVAFQLRSTHTPLVGHLGVAGFVYVFSFVLFCHLKVEVEVEVTLGSHSGPLGLKTLPSTTSITDSHKESVESYQIKARRHSLADSYIHAKQHDKKPHIKATYRVVFGLVSLSNFWT
jgi:hypothetical protein